MNNIKSPLDPDFVEPEWERPDRIPVKGKFNCKQHGRNNNFVFDYTSNTYKHVHKNGGLCSSEVEVLTYMGAKIVHGKWTPHPDWLKPYTDIIK